MEIINRKNPPVLQPIEKIRITEPVIVYLDNHIPVYQLNVGDQDLIKIEFIFNAGRWMENKKTLALAVNKLIKDGTKNHSSKQIADRIEFFGATLESGVSTDIASLTLYSLNKHLDHLLPLTKEIVTLADFPKNEILTFIKNSKQNLFVEKEKVEYLASKKFNEVLFGNNHPYGYSSDENDYDNLKRDDLIDFYKKYYRSDNCKIIIAGKIQENTIRILNSLFGQQDWKGNGQFDYSSNIIKPEKKLNHFVPKKDAVQSAIRIGKLLFNKTHPDYSGMSVLNTVLGGYFGSRLMTNIREDKGYTYGIYSRIGSLLHDGYFFIGTEVGKSVTQNAIREIYSEIDRLCNEVVSEEELQLVKNYMLGSMLSKIDGAFHLSETIKGLILYNLNTEFFYQLIEKIKTITSNELIELANKYFLKDGFYEVVAG